jgi:cell division septal protein FtsQ
MRCGHLFIGIAIAIVIVIVIVMILFGYYLFVGLIAFFAFFEKISFNGRKKKSKDKIRRMSSNAGII